MEVIVLKHKGNLYRAEAEKTAKITIGSGKKDMIVIPDLTSGQIEGRFDGDELVLINKKMGKGTPLRIQAELEQSLDEEGQLSCFWTDWDSEDSHTIPIKYGDRIWRLGRKDDCEIVVHKHYISRYQLSIQISGTQVFIEDGYNGKSSKNGTYLNGKAITGRAEWKPGDTIDIMDVRMKLKNAELTIQNAGNGLNIEKLQADGLYIASQKQHSGRPKYHRSPRMSSELPSDSITLAKPPSKPQRAGKHHGVFSSLLTSGAMIAAGAVTGTLSPAFLAMRGASTIPAITSGIQGKRREKAEKSRETREKKERYLKYNTYIDEQKAIIGRIADEQREIINGENPTPDDCMVIVRELTNSLWERNPQDKDFLDARIGMGYEELCVEVKAPNESGNFKMESDELEELCEQIITETEIVDNVATRIPLRECGTVGVIGDRKRTVALVKNALIELSTLHFYKNLKIVGFFDEKERAEWESLRWLPHVWDADRQLRFITFLSENDGKRESDRLEEYFTAMLQEELDAAENRSGEEIRPPATHYVFLLASRQIEEESELVELLLEHQDALPVTSIFLWDRWESLPHQCRYVVQANDSSVSFLCAAKSSNKKTFFTPDRSFDIPKFDHFCRNMSAIEVQEKDAVAEIPGSITFLQGMGVSKVQDLNVGERWAASRPEKGLATPFAMMAGGKLFQLDLVHHGPHGLVAGTTGSGKSELITSWLLSMAANYKPEDFSFVVIDYKGGGLANTFAGLPHMLGKITNLDEDIYRPIISLYAEVDRRQALFGEVGVNSYGQYAARYHDGKVAEPLPRLLIVVDEFRELRSNEPEFLRALTSIATVGRSLGIHLVLATQSPNGIVDEQIRNNTNFAICMKVRDVSDSKDMLGRTDAAKITQPGRAYIKVGNDEIFSLVQSFWSGAPYIGHIRNDESGGNSVRIVAMDGERIKTVSDEKTRFKSDVIELNAVVRYISDVAKDTGVMSVKCPWRPELPRRLVLDALDVSTCAGSKGGKLPWLKIPIGLFDIPQSQIQGVQYLDFEEGHFAVYGSAGTGKTTLLRTALTAVGRFYTPEEVQIYILDFGGWSMKTFQSMPHVGDVVLDYEEDKFKKFIKLIEREIEERKKKFSAHGISSLRVYRDKISTDTPAILVAIDNLTALFSTYPECEKTMLKLMQEGMSLGIYAIFTANSQTGIPFKIYNSVKNIILFEPVDKSDYSLVGKPVEVKDMQPRPLRLPKVKGRAYYKDAFPIMFQTALPVNGVDDLDIAEQMKGLFAEMNDSWTGNRPQRLPVIPESLTADALALDYRTAVILPVGLATASIAPASLDLSGKYCALFAGTERGAVCRALRAEVGLIRKAFPDSKVYILDDAAGDCSALVQGTERYASVKDTKTSGQLVDDLFAILVQRENARRQRSQEGDADTHAIAEDALVVFVMTDAPELTGRLEDAIINKIEKLTQAAKGLDFIVLAGGTAGELAKYQSERQLIHNLVICQKGVIVSGTVATHGAYFPANMDYAAKTSEPPEGFGWLYQNNCCEQIKLIEEG